MGDKNLHKGHRERMRQKFVDFGAESFLEHELLELALFYPIPRINTNETAHELIRNFKNIHGIFNASAEELTKSRGIGETSAEFLMLLADICKEYRSFSETVNVGTADDISEYFRNYFTDKDSGVCLILCMDSNFQIKNKICFTQKDLMSDISEIRRIIGFLISNKCTRTILGINHPERYAVPDNIDYSTTKFLAEKLYALNISLDDSIIFSGENSFSFKQNKSFSF